MKTLLCICGIILSLAFSSCKESPTNSGGTSDGISETTLFVNSYSYIIVPLNNSVDELPTMDQFNDPYFSCYLSSWYESKKSVRIYFQGRQVTPFPIIRNIMVRNNGEVIEVPVKVNVIDFFTAYRPYTNVPDTLVLHKGTNFVLNIGFKDSVGKAVSSTAILSTIGGYSCGINSASGTKIFSQGYGSDDKYFSFLLSALPDITPSPNDAGMNFTFTISNRKVVIPIKLTY